MFNCSLVVCKLLLASSVLVGIRAQAPPPPPPPPGHPHPPPPAGPHPPGGEHPPGHWSYDDQKDWTKAYPLCQDKSMRQSPIDIVTRDVKPHDDWAVEFVDYDQELQMKSKNNGHSVSVSPDVVRNETKPRIKLAWMPPEVQEFELQELHFHWGDTEKFGSEHKVNGKQAAAEMHMVHFRKGITKDEIGSTPNSVAVVGVFIMPSAQANNELEDMLSELSQVNGTDPSQQAVDPRTENLQHLLPENIHKFYAYEGSLTTPPCYETVTWIVLSSPVYLSQEKLHELSNLATLDSTGLHRISHNFRDVQPLVGRQVYSSTNVKKVTSEELMKQHSESNPDFGEGP